MAEVEFKSLPLERGITYSRGGACSHSCASSEGKGFLHHLEADEKV